ncbi:MAG: DUF1559 domain-containing protein [Thermoguttaceae bacterium]
MNNLKQIGVALQGYEETFRRLPRASVRDENGTPMHSWRVELLPYMEGRSLWSRYNPDEPWNGPNNSKLSAQMPREYACPRDPDAGPPMTSYVAIVGSGTAWPDDGSLRLDDFPDGAANTLLLAEVANPSIHWMEPRDLTLADLAQGMQPHEGMGVSSKHNSGQGACVLYADGSVRFLSSGVPPTILKSLATVDGSEEVDRDSLRQKYPPKLSWANKYGPGLSLAIILVTGILLAFRPFRKLEENPESESAET